MGASGAAPEGPQSAVATAGDAMRASVIKAAIV